MGFDIVIMVVDSVFKRTYFISIYTIVIVENITKFFLYNVRSCMVFLLMLS